MPVSKLRPSSHQGDEHLYDLFPWQKLRIAEAVGECEGRLTVFGSFVRRQEIVLRKPAAQGVGQLAVMPAPGAVADKFFGLGQNPAAADIHA